VTTPPVPFFDVGNPLLAQGPANLDTGSVSGPGGKVGVVTIRTASATQTVFIGAADLRNWAALLTGLADQLSGGLVQASVADVAAVSQPLITPRRR
jgi:hypothetical protein